MQRYALYPDFTMRQQIERAKDIQAALKELQHQMAQLTTPKQYDLDKLSELYQNISKLPDIDSRDTRHYFVLIATYLYSPSAIFVGNPIRSGLCSALAKTTRRCRQEMSRLFAEAKVRYTHTEIFRDKVEQILSEPKREE